MTLSAWSIWYWDTALIPRWILLYAETKESAIKDAEKKDGFWKLESIEEWQ